MQSKRRFQSSVVLTATLFLAALSALAAAENKPVVNINTADAKQLSLLPRVGLALAQRVVDHRKENGPFKSTDELMLVRGVGEKLYAQLKPYLATSGETTLDEKVAGSGRGGKTKGAKSSRKASSKPRAAAKGAAPARTSRPSRQARRAQSARASRTRPAPIALGQPAVGGPR